MFDVQPQIVLVPSIVPVIVTAVILFLATNGPHNWPALWQELTNPPPDARHATRRPSPNSAYVRLSQAELAMRRAQLMSHNDVCVLNCRIDLGICVNKNCSLTACPRRPRISGLCHEKCRSKTRKMQNDQREGEKSRGEMNSQFESLVISDNCLPIDRCNLFY
ncbi:hypothetical protein niasHS_000434 [Heterodera schachtii]|uniref:Uncharacterized protein n=1 Tax=Heterodera schachtii TaxID=97005 RepID=A0ABD2K6X9_HETSC